MKAKNINFDDPSWDKLLEIGNDMLSKGINIRDSRKNISRAAVLRELIKGYDLPAKPKNRT